MEKEIKVGIFGACRGRAFYTALQALDGVKLVAVCDRDAEMIEDTKKYAAEQNVSFDDVKIFDNFEDFIDCGIDAVILTNYFHEHAKYAIKALDKGIAVMSDTTAAPTLKECVELCEAVERNNGKYMLGTNVPYMYGIMEIKKAYDSGAYGNVKYANAEYLHYDDPNTAMTGIAPSKHHWRKYLPKTYYNMHTLGTLMYITGETPVSVNGRAAYSPESCYRESTKSRDCVGYTFCQTEKGSIFATTACAHMGPNGKWFRLNCTKGTLEHARHSQTAMKFSYVPWLKPQDEPFVKEYSAIPEVIDEVEKNATHDGSDYRLAKAFVEYLKGEMEPFFNVYRAVSLSAAGIMSWLSVLNDGNPYKIPDFTNKEERDKWRNHDLTPFPDENGEGATLPQCSK